MYQRLRRSAALMLVVPLLAALLVACGGDDDDGGDDASADPTATSAAAIVDPTATTAPAEVDPTATTAAAPEPTEADAGGASAEFSVTIVDFAYAPETIEVNAGDAVTIEIANNGQSPHTFTISDLVDTDVISSGDSTTIEFTPTESGELTFFCTLHGAATMSGTLTVQ